jgi:hypothetical protein
MKTAVTGLIAAMVVATAALAQPPSRCTTDACRHQAWQAARAAREEQNRYADWWDRRFRSEGYDRWDMRGRP